jgi:hypothetical protein
MEPATTEPASTELSATELSAAEVSAAEVSAAALVTTALVTTGLVITGLVTTGLLTMELAPAGLATAGLVTGELDIAGPVATAGTAISGLGSSEGPGLRHTAARTGPEVGCAATADDIQRANRPQHKRVLRVDFIAAASH